MEVHDFAIIGSGFGGLCMATFLQKEGRNNFVILERADRPGGTWRDNIYPGCCCDVPSHLYWYSFDKHPDWTRHYAAQPEILRNMEDYIERSGLAQRIKYNSNVAQIRWSDSDAVWTVQLSSGDSIQARHVVTATGQLSNPRLPDIAGRDTFAGTSFHSAKWRYDVALQGKRVAVVGNGASAIQFIPVVAEQASELIVFQRSASYVVPRGDKLYEPQEREAFREESAYLASRKAIYQDFESRYPALVQGSVAAKEASRMAREHLEAQVKDPVLREKLWPDYEIGCKRILISDDFYPAMCRPNVKLVTESIDRIETQGVHTKDGNLYPVDVIIYATGFYSTRFLGDMDVLGRKGVSLKTDAWSKAPRAYLGIVEAGFPNFFMLYGPNTNLNHNSIIAMMEAQCRYIMELLKAADKSNAREIEVRSQAVQAYNEKLQNDLKRLSFGSGCTSWYKTKDGDVTNNWSGTVDEYYERTASPELSDFVMA